MTNETKYDIIFVVPRYRAKDGFIWKAIEYRFQSPGVLSLATYLNSRGFNTAILDCNLEQISDDDFISVFNERFGTSDYKYIGFSAATQTINSAYILAEKIKSERSKVQILFGGAHPSALPEDVLKNNFADFVFLGEGELAIEKLLLGEEIENIKGIAFKRNDEIINTGPCERISDLDSLPINDYSLVPMKNCKPLVGTYRKLPATIMVTARGCPGRCTFCSRVVGNKLSVMYPQRIFDEIKVLYYNYGFRQIIFYDDTFISTRNRIEEFCDLIINSDIKISWTCSSRVDKVYPDLLVKMKMAGCHQIMYGVESFNAQVLKNINKKTQPEDIHFAIKETQKAGIEARAAIMLGNPGDTIEILEDNIKQLKKLNPDLIQVTITTPIPGSQMFSEAMTHNQILTYDWDKYEGSDQIVKHENISFEELQKYYRKTYIKYYLRPSFIFRTLFKANSFLKIKVLIIGGFSIIPVIFSGLGKRKKRK